MGEMTQDQGESSVALAAFELGNKATLVLVNGVPTEMTRIEALANGIYIDAMKGKQAARKQYLDLYERGKHEAALRAMQRGW